MSAILSTRKRAFLTLGVLSLLSTQIPSCSSSDGGPGSSNSPTGGSVSIGGVAAVGGTAPSTSSDVGTGGSTGGTNGGTKSISSSVSAGGKASVGGASNASATGGTSVAGSTSAAGSANATGGGGQYVVSMVQSSKANAAEITQDDVKAMVATAIDQAGGIGFIQDGQTVVLKPNLLTPYVGCWSSGTALAQTVNGVTTDWRVTKAVADLVRVRNPSGKILVMEGSNRSTTTAFSLLGYTAANFGTAVDEFIALEGTGCSSRSNSGLVQKPGKSGKMYWVNQRYFEADVLISIGALKTHGSAGTTGCVKNVGIGSTPNSQYSVSTSDGDCTRNMSQSSASSYIDHSLAGLGKFISDFYSVRPADFAIMDGLQGLQHGPCTANAPASDRMNMRLILAARNAVALDTVQALVMNCSPPKIPYLTALESWGMGTTDSTKIALKGLVQGTGTPLSINDVKKSFAGGASGTCGN